MINGASPVSIDTATGKEAPADISSERVKDIFSTIAKKYERFNAVSSFGAYKTWLAGMMRQAPIDENADVLDIAGGTGDVTFTVARAKHPRHIQCTDLVDEMLDVARMHYADGKAEGVPVDFEVVDAQHIPYADESYDAITMAYGIRNMPERDQALSEMFRVLKPGGALVCLEFSTPPNAVWRALYGFYLKHLIPFWGGLITGDREGFVYLSRSIKAFPNQQGLAAMMEKAGFEDVTWKNYTGGIAAVHVAKKPKA
nr:MULTISPECIES: class I SAM-dependent methyltransferase [Eggerthella]